MDPIATTLLSIGGLGLFLMAWGVAARKRRKARVRGTEAGAGAEVGAAVGAGLGAGLGSAGEPGFDSGFGPVSRRVEGRMDALEAVQAELAAKLEGAGNAEDRLQAMAAQLLGLIRDKNATLETALAGLDQLRARMKTMEQMGNAAEARGLFEGLTSRLDALESAQAAATAALEASLAARRARDGEPDPQVALVEQLTRLHAQKDSALTAVIARLGPLESRLGAMESDLGAPARAALMRIETRLEARIEAVSAAQGSAGAALAALEAAGAGPVAEIAQNLARLHAQKDAVVESLLGRIAALETDLAARDPRAALDAFAARLEAMQARLDTPVENPFAEISEQLTRLYAQKDATTETVLARLAPLEARLSEIEGRDPRSALDAFAARLEAMQARLDTPVENPFAEISEQLTRLYAQKDATTESVLARLAPLEARLAEIEGRDPRSALDGFAARLEAMQARLDTPVENPFAEISEQLTRLYAQKDTTTESVLLRLAPLEARLASLAAEIEGPKAALDGFAARLEAMQARLDTPVENPFAEISEQLTRLYAQKDATTETVLARLAPLEARLASLAAEIEGPKAALDGFAARLEAMQARLDTPVENPFAEISAQLTSLYAQKDATTEGVLARLAPLEVRLAEIEGRDPRSALDGFAARLEAMQSRLDTPVENPFAEISAQLTSLYAQKDATTETVLARLAPLEARLSEIEGRDPRSALDGFAARLEAMQARLDMPVENPFAEISEQLTGLYAQKDATAETVFARLAPLEAKLAEMEARDPRGILDGFGTRLEMMHRTQGEVAAGLAALRAVLGDGDVANPFAAIAEQLTLLHAQRDASLAALEARLAPLEEKLARLDTAPPDPARGDEAAAAEAAARAEAREIADQLAALKAAAAQTELFADRIAVLEATLPRLNAAQSQLMRALERQAQERRVQERAAGERAASAGTPDAGAAQVASTAPAGEDMASEATGGEHRAGGEGADPFAAFRDLPRVVSLHQK